MRELPSAISETVEQEDFYIREIETDFLSEKGR
jgi:hypothetical protein